MDCTSFMTLSQSLSHKVMVLQDVLFGVTEVRQHRYSLRVPLPRLCASLHAWVCPCKNRPLKGPAATQPSPTRGLFSSAWWQYSKKHGMGEHAVFLIQPTEKSCISLSQNIYRTIATFSLPLHHSSLYTGVYHRAVGFDLLSCYNTK